MLKRPICIPVAGLALATAALLVPVTSGASVPATAASTTWGTWQGQALSAVAHYRGDGPLTAGEPSPVVTSSVATPTGPVSVAQRSLVAQDSGGQILVQETVLGRSQVVVTETDPTAGNRGATLVLDPGSSTVAGTYPRPGSAGAPATAAMVRHLGPASDDHAHLTVAGNCYPTPQAPVVISTDFGPLVDGEGIIDCTQYETLSLIVSIYRGLLTHVGTTEGGSSTGSRLSYSVNSYYFCTHTTGTHDFRTSEIWAVNGTDEGGATSSEAGLHCT